MPPMADPQLVPSSCTIAASESSQGITQVQPANLRMPKYLIQHTYLVQDLVINPLLHGQGHLAFHLDPSATDRHILASMAGLPLFVFVI